MEKREILQALPQTTLNQFTGTYGLDVDEQSTKEDLVEALARAKSVGARELLENMSVVALKAIAQQFSLPKGPRQKAKLIDAILAAKAPQPLELSAVTTDLELAALLGETEPEPIETLKRIVEVIGVDRTKQFAARAMETDSAEGMWYGRGGSRKRRTLGGCFFRLVRDGLTKAERRRAMGSSSPGSPGPQPLSPMDWKGRREFLDEATRADAHPAEATTVKITIIGRPNRVLQPPDNNAVIALLERTEPPKNLPKGLPQPKGKTSYAVYISLKQWRKVEPKLKDPSDTLIIEGFPMVDEAFNGISVMATNTSTRKLKQEQAAALQAKSQPSDEAATS